MSREYDKRCFIFVRLEKSECLFFDKGDGNVDSGNILFHFSGAYRQQDFYKGEDIEEIDCEHLYGTNCCLDEKTREWLEKEIAVKGTGGIHFLDSGNYHYMTRLWMEQIRQPFDLLVLDHHTDMDFPMLEELLTCGSWLRNALEGQENMKEVYLIGPEQKDVERIGDYHKGKMHIMTQEQMHQGNRPEEAKDGFPIYISIDKDVLGEQWARTAWTQGDMTLEEMCHILDSFIRKREVLGIDICGEAPRTGNVAQECLWRNINEKTNDVLFGFLEDYKRAGFFEKSMVQ